MTLAVPVLLLGARGAVAEGCDGLKAEVVLGEVRAEGAKVSASGEWKPSSGSDTALIEISIDGDRHDLRTVFGGGGHWSFEQVQQRQLNNFCGAHVLQVDVYPSYRNGVELSHCYKGAARAMRRFVIDCAPVAAIDSCDLRCAAPKGAATRVCKGTCTGVLGGGMALAPYQALWSDGKSLIPGAVGSGPWRQEITCLAGSTVSFRLRDQGGTGRLSVAATRICGAPSGGDQPPARYHPGETSSGRLDLKLYRRRPNSSPASAPAD